MSDPVYRFLTIYQPWAWLIVNGYKRVENRTWKHLPLYRGPLFIHAAKGVSRKRFDECVEFAAGAGVNLDEVRPQLDKAFAEEQGGIVGIAEVVDARWNPKTFESGKMSNGFRLAGGLGMDLANATRLSFVPLKGGQGWRRVDADQLTKYHRYAWEGLARKHLERKMLNAKEAGVMAHACGRKVRGRLSACTRNHYVGKSETWDALVERSLAVSRKPKMLNGDTVYHLTELGLTALREHMERYA